VVRGLTEGRAYPLPLLPGADEVRWVVGRKRGLPIALDYDPFVSLENTLVVRRASGASVTDLPQSRNGTTLNFERLARDVETPVEHGDVIGVGRTLFVLQERPARPRPRPGGPGA
jgi:pSer/pThr/pTyr-binding forkhead associated (FHA) protein